MTLLEQKLSLLTLQEYLLQFYPQDHKCAFIRSFASINGDSQIYWLKISEIYSTPIEVVSDSILWINRIVQYARTANSWQAQFGRFIRLKLFSIFGVHGKLKVLGQKSRTAACQQIVSGHPKEDSTKFKETKKMNRQANASAKEKHLQSQGNECSFTFAFYYMHHVKLFYNFEKLCCFNERTLDKKVNKTF